MCFCVRVPTFCLHVRILLCGWACVREDAICVWQKVNSEGTLRLHSHSWPGTFSKKFIRLLDLFFPMYEKQTWTSSGPCARKHYVLWNHASYYSTLPFTVNMNLLQDFKQLAESWEHKKAHSTVSLQQVRVKNIRPEGCQRESLN